MSRIKSIGEDMALASEKFITHARVRELTGLHPFDATRLLQSLVRDAFLELHNPGRGAVYCIPGAAIPKPEEVFGAGSEQSGGSSAHLPPRSAHLPESASGNAEQRDANGCLLSDQLDASVLDSLDRLTTEFRAGLEKIAADPRNKGKIPSEAMRQVILAVCRGHYVALSSLAELVNRDTDALRQQHLKPLAKEGKLRLAFPTAPTHAKQALWARRVSEGRVVRIRRRVGDFSRDPASSGAVTAWGKHGDGCCSSQGASAICAGRPAAQALLTRVEG